MKKILVVNNDFDTMSLLKSWLQKKTYEVTFTGNRDEVNDIIKNFNPQLVMVDVLQKECIENIRSDKKTNNIPILLMTGYTLKEQSSLIDADDSIEKPFNLPLLEKKIERLIQKGRTVEKVSE